jgi:hypothetical protein
MLVNANKIKRYAGKIGDLSNRGLREISSFESKVSKFDKEMTGGLAGELYSISPFRTVYDSTIQPVKSGLKLVRGVSKSIESGKPQYAIKSALDLVKKEDPLLRFGEINPAYRIARSPYFNQYALN